MTDDELRVIIERHERWLNGQEGGERANLCGADLRGANLTRTFLYRADLRNADLRGAHLMGAYLAEAYLQNADLSGADLYGAHLCRANLADANLTNAELQHTNMSGSYLIDACLSNANLTNVCLLRANLYGAKLYDANLCGTNLCDANLWAAKDVPFIPMACPDSGSFTGWKKANGHIVKLLIPEDARRSSATGRKCRCDKAIVVAIETLNGEPAGLDEIASDYDDTFIYKIGETVTVPNFCEDRFKGCAEGIHFFINRQEAVDYN